MDAVPEAVFVATGPQLQLTNDAADRLFAGRPVVDRADLLSRFEPVAVDRPDALPAADRPDARGDAVIVRQRNRPNRWFALRTVDLDAPSDGSEAPPASTADPGPPPEQPIAFVLRDVTDTPDLRPLREAFLGLVSHELRTPITTIYAGSNVLARSARLSVPATQTLARDVSAEAARLYDVVEDLLALGRLERAVLDPLDEPVHVAQAIDAAIRVASGRHPSARIRRRGAVRGVVARGDATYVDQAVRDVVLALIRRPGQAADAAIDVEVRVDRRRDTLTIHVADEGPALGPSELEGLFALAELGAPASAPGGLGLFVARQLVEAMGGRVGAAGRPGGPGLEITIELRLA